VRWQKLGEVENEYTSEKLVLSAIVLPKNFTIGRNLTKFWQKNKFAQFFWDMVYMYIYILYSQFRVRFGGPLADIVRITNLLTYKCCIIGWTVAKTCCISQCAECRKKLGFLTHHGGQPPELIPTRLGVNNYVSSLTLYSYNLILYSVSQKKHPRRFVSISSLVIDRF